MTTTLTVCVFGLLCWIASINGCPNGWSRHDDSCYLYVKESYNWFNAQFACQMLDGYLVELNTAAENQYVAGIVHGHGGHDVWIGLEDIAEEGVFVFPSSKASPSQTFWANGEPQDSGGKEDCTFMNQAGQWGDNQCQAANYPSICEKPDDTSLIAAGRFLVAAAALLFGFGTLSVQY